MTNIIFNALLNIFMSFAVFLLRIQIAHSTSAKITRELTHHRHELSKETS